MDVTDLTTWNFPTQICPPSDDIYKTDCLDLIYEQEPMSENKLPTTVYELRRPPIQKRTPVKKRIDALPPIPKKKREKDPTIRALLKGPLMAQSSLGEAGTSLNRPAVPSHSMPQFTIPPPPIPPRITSCSRFSQSKLRNYDPEHSSEYCPIPSAVILPSPNSLPPFSKVENEAIIKAICAADASGKTPGNFSCHQHYNWNAITHYVNTTMGSMNRLRTTEQIVQHYLFAIRPGHLIDPLTQKPYKPEYEVATQAEIEQYRQQYITRNYQTLKENPSPSDISKNMITEELFKSFDPKLFLAAGEYTSSTSPEMVENRRPFILELPPPRPPSFPNPNIMGTGPPMVAPNHRYPGVRTNISRPAQQVVQQTVNPPNFVILQNEQRFPRAYSIGGMTTPTMYRLPSMQPSPAFPPPSYESYSSNYQPGMYGRTYQSGIPCRQPERAYRVVHTGRPTRPNRPQFRVVHLSDAHQPPIRNPLN